MLPPALRHYHLHHHHHVGLANPAVDWPAASPGDAATMITVWLVLTTTATHLQVMESVSGHVQVALAEERVHLCLVRRNEIMLRLQQKSACNHQFHAPNEVSIKTYTITHLM